MYNVYAHGVCSLKFKISTEKKQFKSARCLDQSSKFYREGRRDVWIPIHRENKSVEFVEQTNLLRCYKAQCTHSFNTDKLSETWFPLNSNDHPSICWQILFVMLSFPCSFMYIRLRPFSEYTYLGIRH